MRNRHPYWIITNTKTGTIVNVYNLADFYRKMKWHFPIHEMRSAIFKNNEFIFQNFHIEGAGYFHTEWAILELTDRLMENQVKKQQPVKKYKHISLFPHLQGRACYN